MLSLSNWKQHGSQHILAAAERSFYWRRDRWYRRRHTAYQRRHTPVSSGSLPSRSNFFIIQFYFLSSCLLFLPFVFLIFLILIWFWSLTSIVFLIFILDLYSRVLWRNCGLIGLNVFQYPVQIIWEFSPKVLLPIVWNLSGVVYYCWRFAGVSRGSLTVYNRVRGLIYTFFFDAFKHILKLLDLLVISLNFRDFSR